MCPNFMCVLWGRAGGLYRWKRFGWAGRKSIEYIDRLCDLLMGECNQHDSLKAIMWILYNDTCQAVVPRGKKYVMIPSQLTRQLFKYFGVIHVPRHSGCRVELFQFYLNDGDEESYQIFPSFILWDLQYLSSPIFLAVN